jgi:hypothetical protein
LQHKRTNFILLTLLNRLISISSSSFRDFKRSLSFSHYHHLFLLFTSSLILRIYSSFMDSSKPCSQLLPLPSMRNDLSSPQLSTVSSSANGLSCISGVQPPLASNSTFTNPFDCIFNLPTSQANHNSSSQSPSSFASQPHQHPLQPQQQQQVLPKSKLTPHSLNIAPLHHNMTSSSLSNDGMPFVRILEQPARCALRFRYECEGRSAGSIPGCNSTAENKTFPTIELVNYNGPAAVVVSCVTKQMPYRPHPHNLVGKEGCKKGVCTMIIKSGQNRCTFTSLGIQCVKKKDIEDSLRLRDSIKVDPYRSEHFLPTSFRKTKTFHLKQINLLNSFSRSFVLRSFDIQPDLLTKIKLPTSI